MPNPYLFALEMTECEPDIKKYCIYQLSNPKCDVNVNNCSYPSKMNPLCFCKNPSNCPRFYSIVAKDGKTYIFYKCLSCQNLMKHEAKDLTKILDIIHSKYIFYNKDLESLMEKLNVSPETDDLEEIITFFEDIFKVVEN
jgi:hypothetical protein